MRVLKVWFAIATIFIGGCVGQETKRRSYPMVETKSLLAEPEKYPEKDISIVGELDLSHFETANIRILR